MSTEVYLNKGFLPKTVCLLLSGKAGVGKTYSANVIQSYLSGLGYKVTRESFATGVKQVATYMGWDGKKDDKGRVLLQDIGKIGRKYDKDIWVRSTFERLEQAVGFPFDVVIIDDCRFINEVSFVRDNEVLYNTIVVRLQSSEREILKGTPAYYDDSETELDKYMFDYIIHNIEDGEDAILRYFKPILEEHGLIP